MKRKEDNSHKTILKPTFNLQWTVERANKNAIQFGVDKMKIFHIFYVIFIEYQNRTCAFVIVNHFC